ncbi:hypothetical protein ABZ725_42090 [Streptomyces sp. NPDC006872]|uniref:hypothetical protein n=1 Tax=Streptomyces sp. NPDC006872 TaxID=3155720 RepID=UPI0033EA2501
MAREVVITIRCDTKACGSKDETEEFVILRDGKPKTVALCRVHKGPVVEAYEVGSDEAPPTPKKPRRGSHAVVAIEDWKPEDQ